MIATPSTPRSAPQRALPCLPDRRHLGAPGPEACPPCLRRVDAPEMIPAAFDAGVDVFVTADIHGPFHAPRELADLTPRDEP